MQLEKLIGLQLAVGFHETKATPGLIARLKRLHVRSLVVFSRNFLNPKQYVHLILNLEKALGEPLLVMVDHEGGRIIRFSSGVTRFPDALSQGKTQSAKTVERQGAVEAKELKRLHTRVNLAPCVDVLAEGCDPVIGDRSYGFNAETVARLGEARIRGLQTNGIAACAKHFPGLGAVPRDPHKTLPIIHLGREAMESVHLLPFRAAIKAKVATIMSSHVCYPGLGEPKGLPATFSRRLINGLLRGHLGFSGVVLTDDLEMGALRAFGGVGEATLRAAEAGHDMFLICSDLQAAEEALSQLKRAYQSGRLSPASLQASVSRIKALRKKYLA